MNEPIKTLSTETRILNIFVDEQPETPREWDNMGTMLCTHKRYSLGDTKEKFNFDDYNGWDEVKQALIKEKNVAVILPLYLLDHSGITMKTTFFNDKWDSGQVGFIYASKEKIRKEYSVKRISKKLIEKVTKLLINEVEIYDQYLTGDVYRFEVKDNKGEIIDSCAGFYGSDFATNGIAENLDTDLAELLKKD